MPGGSGDGGPLPMVGCALQRGVVSPSNRSARKPYASVEVASMYWGRNWFSTITRSDGVLHPAVLVRHESAYAERPTVSLPFHGIHTMFSGSSKRFDWSLSAQPWFGLHVFNDPCKLIMLFSSCQDFFFNKFQNLCSFFLLKNDLKGSCHKKKKKDALQPTQ
jgi:hypothetical protein